MNQNASRTPLQGAATQNAAATAGHHKDAPAAAHQKAMMEAMQITGFDGPAGLRYAEAPVPEPGPEDVALDVEYAGVGYIEALLAGGLIDLPLPYVPGLEAVGRVRSLGSQITNPSPQADADAEIAALPSNHAPERPARSAAAVSPAEADSAAANLPSPDLPLSTLKPGDPVVALTINRGGAYGQVAVTNANLVAPLPPGMDPALAAAVPANTTTALVALERIAHVKPGEHVLVHAAAGGLGSQFGQIARLLGAARTVGVVGSEAKRRAALDLGYDEVWLRSELGDAAGGQFDVVVDPVAGPARQTSLDLLRLGGRRRRPGRRPDGLEQFAVAPRHRRARFQSGGVHGGESADDGGLLEAGAQPRSLGRGDGAHSRARPNPRGAAGPGRYGRGRNRRQGGAGARTGLIWPDGPRHGARRRKRRPSRTPIGAVNLKGLGRRRL